MSVINTTILFIDYLICDCVLFFGKNNIKVFCNNFQIVKILNNKISTLKFLENLGLNVPLWKNFKNNSEYNKSIDFFFR